MKRQKLTSSELLCGLCFALCFFAFMLTEAFINERCAVILGSGCCKFCIYLWACLYRFGVSVVFSSAPPMQKRKIKENGADYHWRSVSWGGSGFAFCRSSGTLSDKLFRSPAADRPYQRMRVLQYGYVFCREPVYGTIDRHGYGGGDSLTVCST